MRTWLNPVLELMTAEQRAMGFDLFCDWRAWEKRKEKDSYQSGGRCVSCINHPHSPSCYLLVCTNDHLVLFNSDLKQTDMSDVYTIFLMVLRDMIRQRMCLRDGTGGAGGGGRSPGRLAGCPARGSPRCLLLRCWNMHRARDSARVPLTTHLEQQRNDEKV